LNKDTPSREDSKDTGFKGESRVCNTVSQAETGRQHLSTGGERKGGGEFMNRGRLLCVLPFGPFGVKVMECIQGLASAVGVLGSHPGLWAILGIR